jgi:predicted ATPase
MLDVGRLKRQIQAGIKNTVVPAIKEMELHRHPQESEAANDMAKEVSEMFDEVVTEALSDIIANAIDYYVKHIAITGQIITTGSPTIQQARITSQPMPILNGKIPNTLGVS